MKKEGCEVDYVLVGRLHTNCSIIYSAFICELCMKDLFTNSKSGTTVTLFNLFAETTRNYTLRTK